MQSCFKTVMPSSKGKVIHTLASELINEWLEASCDEPKSKITVSDNSVAPDELLDNLASLNVGIYARNESDTESFQKKAEENCNFTCILTYTTSVEYTSRSFPRSLELINF